MKKQIIGFDFDGVIANQIPAKIKLAKKLGFAILPQQTHSNILQKIIGKSNYKKLAYSLYREETLKFKPCNSVKTLIKKLKTRGSSLVIISARGKEESLFAQKWLKKQKLTAFFDKIIFCRKSEKHQFIRKYKANIYIDDSPEILMLCPKNITKVLYNHCEIDFGKKENWLVIKNFKELIDNRQIFLYYKNG